MTQTKQSISPARKVYEAYWESYLSGNIEAFAACIDEAFSIIGTSEGEISFGKEAVAAMYEAQFDEVVGKAERRNRQVREIPAGDMLQIIEFSDIYVLIDSEWSFYSKFRLSTLLHHTPDGWKLLQQHGSLPDMRVGEGETMGIGKISKENLKLRDAIKRRTVELENKNRELAVEAALEKVRSRSLGMQKSDELQEVIQIVYEQFAQLGIQVDHTGFIIDYPTNEDMHIWLADRNGVPSEIRIPYFDAPHWNSFVEAKKKGDDFFANHHDFKEKNKFYTILFELIPGLSDEIKTLYLECPGLDISTVLMDNVGLYIESFSGKPYTDAENQTLKRFGKVFQQAYTRFIDLQKAEAQAKEAQIESALERLRSRTNAMRDSSEIEGVTLQLFDEFEKLGRKPDQLSISIFEKDIEQFNIWARRKEKKEIIKDTIPYTFHAMGAKLVEAWEKQDPFVIIDLTGDSLKEYNEKRMERVGKRGHHIPTEKRRVIVSAVVAMGLLSFAADSMPDEETNRILQRFAEVFNQTYTRFRDIQKAEAQAREAQIEAALERVRSRGMAMRKSDELREAGEILCNEIIKLGIETITSGFVIMDDEEKIGWNYAPDPSTGKIMPVPVGIPHDKTENMLAIKAAWKNQLPVFVVEMDEQGTIDHQTFVAEQSTNFPITAKQLIAVSPAKLKLHNFNFKEGYLLIVGGTRLTDDQEEMMLRFTKVFQQTYTRFLDLQKAEAQAREAQLELSMERIRSQVTAMKESSDLLDIVVTMRTEFVKLGHEAHYFWHMRWLPETYAKAMTSGDGTKIGMVMTLPRSIHGEIQAVAEWEKGREPVHVLAMDAETAVDYVHKMVTWGDFERVDPQAPTLDDIRHIGGLTFVMARTTHGEIGYSLPGVVPDPSKDAVDTLVRFAGVFDLAYRRFEDLKKAERQKRETEIELALERTRSHSMLMQHSDEIKNISEVFHQQLLLLDIPTEFSYVWLPDESKNNHQFWASWAEEEKEELIFQSKQVTYPLDKTEPYTAACYQAWSAPEIVHEAFIPPSDISAFFSTWGELLDGAKNLIAEKFKEGIYYSEAYMRYGCFGINIRRELTADEKQVLKRFSTEFERAYTRFLDLQKAEAQAREAEIQLALERVRARSMAMHKSEELLDVITVVSEQLHQLHFRFNHVSFANNEIEEDYKFWSSLKGMDPVRFNVPYASMTVFTGLKAAQQNGVHFYTDIISQEDNKKWHEHLLEHGGAEIFSEKVNEYIMNRGMARSISINPNIILILANYASVPYTDEENKIIARFGRVFEQSYTRFLDLQRAENQGREAKIEAALEKVRSRTMGMQRSDELAEVANVLFTEMNGLVHNLWTCGFVLCERDREEDEWWLSLEDGFSRGFFLPNVNDFAHATLYEGWLEGDAFRTVQLDGDKLQEHYNWLMQIPVAKNIFDEMEAAGMQRPEWQKLHAAYFSKGYLVIITREPCPEEEIFKRFATVFDQTYTRFLDLKKAEAQARESQIEAALEKVRSRSLAMQSPDELIEVAQLLREEMGALGVEELETSSIYIHDENYGNTQCWFTIKDSPSGKAVTDTMTINLQDTWVGRKMLSFYHSDAKQTSILMQGEQRVEWIRYCGEKSNVFTPEGFYGDSIPERTYHLYKFSNGYIGAASPGDISGESWDLLKRATSVFSFAYTRFRDLQKAETRARESRIELALERIRAQVASMQESSDLFDIVVGMRTEFLALGHEADSFWHMRWLPESYEMSMTSEDGSRIGMVISLPKFVHDEIPALAEWEKGDDPIYVLALDAEGAWSYIENMNTHGDYELADPNASGKEDIEHIGGLTFIIARTTHGEIGYSLPGMVPDPPKDALDTLVRFAGVFDLAYKRFEDLKAAERQALMIREERDRLEIALNELHATQDQLVQQEKLASLGQLTAGIAHEIKNPLNFVNNFSEVSLELIDEALEELASVQTRFIASQDDNKLADIKEILDDVQSNLTKIHQHGTRANSIVSSMLQHSRGGSGKMEPTDLNALVKEYVNLAFHGMRAGKAPINVDIQLDLDESLGTVNLIGEDFSRVVLNMANNAFDAMREKVKIESGYTPKLTVRSKRLANSVEIQIEDNGPGIHDDIKDKILQPFFTTKKGTEGTGLGLSITNDIIKAHGGELSIESRSGKTIFRIKINS